MSGPIYGLIKINALIDATIRKAARGRSAEKQRQRVMSKIKEQKAEFARIADAIPRTEYAQLIAQARQKGFAADASGLDGMMSTFAMLVCEQGDAFMSLDEACMVNRTNEAIINRAVLYTDNMARKAENIRKRMEGGSTANEISELETTLDVGEISQRSGSVSSGGEPAMSPDVAAAYGEFVSECIANPDFDKLKASVTQIISSDRFDDNYKVAQIRARMESAAGVNEDAETLMLKNEYATLCDSLGIEPDGNLTYSEIAAAVAQMNERLEQAALDEYVNDSFTTVMERFGYEVAASETVQSAVNSIEKKYYEVSDSSVLNVSRGKDGAVLFEVMGRGDELNDAEKEAVCGDMHRFCPDYFKIRDALAEFGIVIDRERMLEADVKYARAAHVVEKKDQRRGNYSETERSDIL